MSISISDTHCPLELQPTKRPPARPAYILRGHAAHIHAVRFLRYNTRLLTGDANGWVVLWNIATKRAAAVWRAHDAPILGFGSWTADKIITHGRDFRLCVWQLGLADENNLSAALPVDDTTADRKQPWLLHVLRVNTLNFCSFAMCSEHCDPSDDSSILVAVPSTSDGNVEIFQLPTEHRSSHVTNTGSKTGLLMSLALLRSPCPSGPLQCLCAYENGTTAVHTLDAATNTWCCIYTSPSQTQPILSICAVSLSEHQSDLTFFTSGISDIIAKHSLGSSSSLSTLSTTILPTSASDSRCLLSSSHVSQTPSSDSSRAVVSSTKTRRTKHSGQQSLTVRSDGHLLATAGWDGRVRVYATGTLEEVAVLAWHRNGCYAVDFADVGGQAEEAAAMEKDSAAERRGLTMPSAMRNTRTRREERAKTVHWVAAGSKDGKVSLWDVF